MNITTTLPININGSSFKSENAKDVSGVVSGTKDAVIGNSEKVKVGSNQLPNTSMNIEVGLVNTPEGFLAAQENRSQESRAAGEAYMKNIMLAKAAKDQFTQVADSIFQDRPDLVDKDWDFSLDPQDNIIILHNGDLSDEDVNWLQSRIQNVGFGETLSELKSSMISLVESERGSDMYSTNIGRYDISDTNFDQIIHFREFLDKTKGEDANQVFTSQLATRADDPYKELTYSYLEKDGSVTKTKTERS